MLTLFTTTKAFEGINKSNQINAINSWLLAPYATEVIIFERSKGIEVLGNNSAIIIEDDVKKSDFGVPVINYMFEKASEISKYPICCFLNADIILTKKFFEDILEIHEQVKNNYLVVGQRLDTDINHIIDFNNNWEVELFKHHSFADHPACGSDFFVFPKKQYSQQNLPPMLVGRNAWDNYMIYDARVKQHKLIDLSYSTRVIHQNHDYSHKSKDKKVFKVEEEYNYQFLPNNNPYQYILSYCDFLYVNRVVKKNYLNGDWDKYWTLSLKYAKSKGERIKVKLEVRFLKLIEKVLQLLF